MVPYSAEAHRLRRLAEMARFSFVRSPCVGYVGWTGSRNFGDEIIADLFRELLSPVSVVWRGTSSRTWIEARLKQKRMDAAVLGGGTLLGGYSFMSRFDQLQRQSGRSWIVGTGVLDPRFPGDRDDYNAIVSRWGRTLERCSYIGVRSDRCRSLLPQIDNVEVFGDPIWQIARLAEIMGLRSRSPQRPTLLLAPAELGGRTEANEHLVHGTYIRLARSALSSGWRVQVMAAAVEDLVLAHSLAAEVGRSQVSLAPMRWREALRDLSSYDAVCTTRMHLGAAALSVGVPVVQLGYRPKVWSLYGGVGALDCVLAPEQFESLCPPQYFEIVDQVRCQSESIRGRAIRIAARQTERCAQLVSPLLLGEL